jgi:hypothetical protein
MEREADAAIAAGHVRRFNSGHDLFAELEDVLLDFVERVPRTAQHRKLVVA